MKKLALVLTLASSLMFAPASQALILGVGLTPVGWVGYAVILTGSAILLLGNEAGSDDLGSGVVMFASGVGLDAGPSQTLDLSPVVDQTIASSELAQRIKLDLLAHPAPTNIPFSSPEEARLAMSEAGYQPETIEWFLQQLETHR